MKNIKAASVQFQSNPGDKSNNMETIEHFVKQAASEQVQLIVFPECCITGYWFLRKLSRNDLSALAEKVFDGPSSQHLQNLAQRYEIIIGAGLIEEADDCRLFNTYVVALPNGKMYRHRKIHAFINEHISQGHEYTVFDTPHDCRIGVLTCFDNNIIENARMNALMGADILLAPHQTGGCRSKSPHGMKAIDPKLWEERNTNPKAIEEEFLGPKGRGWLMRWLPSRAHDNGLFLIFSNGVGIDDDEVRTGNAMIIDPYGRIITETWKAQDDMVIAELDASLLDQCTGRRWLQARKPTLYHPLTQSTGLEKDIREVRF